MAYTNQNIRDMVSKALQNPSTLYKLDFINYRGSAHGKRYTEIAAAEMRMPHNLSLLQSIPSIHRQESYCTDSHKALAARQKPLQSSRDEEWIAIDMQGRTMATIGEVIDFQIPLKNVKSDAAGKADLLSYNKSSQQAYLLELKKPDSTETLLRCALEVYTYWKIIDARKLLCDFAIENAQLRKAVLIFENCAPYADYMSSASPEVKQLMDVLGVELFVLNADANDII